MQMKMVLSIKHLIFETKKIPFDFSKGINIKLNFILHLYQLRPYNPDIKIYYKENV